MARAPSGGWRAAAKSRTTRSSASALEQFAAFALDPAGGLEVGLRGGRGVEQGEAHAGLEEAFGVGHRPQAGVGGHEVAGRMLASEPAPFVAPPGGEQAGAVEVEERRQRAQGEAVDLGGEAPRDVVVAEPAAHDMRVPALDEGVVVGAAGAGLGEAPDMQLGEAARRRGG